jgi:hypothetical protein
LKIQRQNFEMNCEMELLVRRTFFEEIKAKFADIEGVRVK